MEIRPERPGDRQAIADVHRRAFAGEGEARLVDAIRASEGYIPELSLVAEEGGGIAGHVLVSRVRIGSEPALCLAPVAVAPEHQRRGIGGALVRAAAERAQELGERVIVLLGHPEYYPRFGFEPASRFGIEHAWPVDEAVFMALPLDGGAPPRGRLAYPETFGPVELWEGARGYLNTASYGLPPKPAWDALQAALADWHAGRTSWEPWNDETNRARATWSRLVHAPVEQVGVGATVSELVGLVAASLPRLRVLSTDIDFASLLFPWLVNDADVRTVPVAELANAVDGQTDVVAFSAVQSSNGEVADLDAVAAAAAAHDALTVVDATHAVGWLPLDATRFDAVACAGYKWLLSPRGTAYLYVSPELLERIRPLHAGWYSSDDPYASYYGLPLRLAETARRLDTSPAWFSWVGAAPALETLEQIGIERIHEHDVALANRFRAGLGLEPSNSAIVSVDITHAAEKLAGAGIRAAVRAGGLRASFHAYNTEEDVDAALEALR